MNNMKTIMCGCKDMEQFKMFNSTDSKDFVCDWIVKVVKESKDDICLPFIVGVGIGGTSDYSSLLSKKALLREITDSNSDEFYVKLESQLLSQINTMDEDMLAVAVKIEFSSCHIAGVPVTVQIECYSSH